MRLKVSIVLFITLSLITASTYAFDCYVTAIKGNCWKNFSVTLDVIDNGTKKSLIVVKIPKGKMWVREKFSCKEKQGLDYKANFTPAIWNDKSENNFNSKRVWFLPDDIKKGAVAWNMNVCFPTHFSEVPLPTDADSSCGCSIIKSIPPVT